MTGTIIDKPLEDLHHLLQVARMEAKAKEQAFVVYLIDIALSDLDGKASGNKEIGDMPQDMILTPEERIAAYESACN